MKFFEFSCGRTVPINAIERIARLPANPGRPAYLTHRVTMADGWSGDISTSEFEDLKRATCPVLPAQPGWWLLSYWYNEDPALELDPFVSRDPIIAFRIEGDGAPVPVVLDPYVTEMLPRNAVLHPDGLVCNQDSTFDSIDKWEAEQREWAVEARNRRAEEKAEAKTGAEGERRQSITSDARPSG